MGGRFGWPRAEAGFRATTLYTGVRVGRVRMACVCAGQRGRWWWPSAEGGFRATTLYAGVRVGRVRMVCVCAGRRGGDDDWARNADFAQRPYRRVCGSAGTEWSGAARDSVAGADGWAWKADFWQRSCTLVCGSVGPGWSGSSRDSPRNDPIRGCAGRPSRDDLGPRGTARLAGVVGRGIRVSRKDPMRGVRVGWAGMAGGTRGSAESRKNPTQLSGRRIGAGWPAGLEFARPSRDRVMRAEKQLRRTGDGWTAQGATVTVRVERGSQRMGVLATTRQNPHVTTVEQLRRRPGGGWPSRGPVMTANAGAADGKQDGPAVAADLVRDAALGTSPPGWGVAGGPARTSPRPVRALLPLPNHTPPGSQGLRPWRGSGRRPDLPTPPARAGRFAGGRRSG